MSRNAEYDYHFKVLLLGDSFVGKTSLLTSYVDGKFNLSTAFTPSIGIDFKHKLVEVPLHHQTGGRKVKVRLQIWDTAGQERFHSVAFSYYRSVSGIVLVYDVGKPESLENVPKWAQTVIDHSGEATPIKMLLGNKCDLGREKRIISREEGEAVAQKIGFLHEEVSSMDCQGLDQVFMELISRMIEKQERDELMEAEKVRLEEREREDQKTGFCCS